MMTRIPTSWLPGASQRLYRHASVDSGSNVRVRRPCRVLGCAGRRFARIAVAPSLKLLRVASPSFKPNISCSLLERPAQLADLAATLPTQMGASARLGHYP